VSETNPLNILVFVMVFLLTYYSLYLVFMLGQHTQIVSS